MMSVKRGSFRRIGGGVLAIAWPALLACDDPNPQSLASAQSHVSELVVAAATNVRTLRRELPLGADRLSERWSNSPNLVQDPLAIRRALDVVRNASSMLRQASATFFAISHRGVVVRSDQSVDEIAGISLFESFPSLKTPAAYQEAIGQLPQASAAPQKPDALWLASATIRHSDGSALAQYIAGVSWTDLAQVLETDLRARVREHHTAGNARTNLPLLYCFVLAEKVVYSAPRTPELDAQAISKLRPQAHLSSAGEFSQLLTIEGRTFALAVRSFPALAPQVALAVLRSET